MKNAVSLLLCFVLLFLSAFVVAESNTEIPTDILLLENVEENQGVDAFINAIDAHRGVEPIAYGQDEWGYMGWSSLSAAKSYYGVHRTYYYCGTSGAGSGLADIYYYCFDEGGRMFFEVVKR